MVDTPLDQRTGVHHAIEQFQLFIMNLPESAPQRTEVFRNGVADFVWRCHVFIIYINVTRNASPVNTAMKFRGLLD